MDSPFIVQVATTMGIVSTTSFWSMNFTVNHLTFPALLLGGVPKSPTGSKGLSSRFFTPSTDDPHVSKPFLNRQWQEVFWRGHQYGPPSAITSGVAFLSAAYFAEPASSQRYFCIAAAVAAVSVVPWTLLVMLPTNNELHRRGDAQRAKRGDSREINEDGRDLMELINEWLRYNNTRALLAMVATVAGVAASVQ